MFADPFDAFILFYTISDVYLIARLKSQSGQSSDQWIFVTCVSVVDAEAETTLKSTQGFFL